MKTHLSSLHRIKVKSGIKEKVIEALIENSGVNDEEFCFEMIQSKFSNENISTEYFDKEIKETISLFVLELNDIVYLVSNKNKEHGQINISEYVYNL